MDCGVCLEQKEEDNFTILPCNHKVCNVCFPKIRVPVCPFCRCKYGNSNDRYYNEIDDELFEFDFNIIYFSDDEERTIKVSDPEVGGTEWQILTASLSLG